MKLKFLPFFIFLLIVSCTEKKDKQNMENTKPPVISLKDFFKNPKKDNFKISPDGNHFAFLAPFERRMNIFVKNVDSDTSKRITSVTDRDISRYIWANNNRILFLRDKGGNENFKLFGVDIDGSNLQALTDFKGVRTIIIDELPEIRDEIIIGMNKRTPSVFDPYRLNIKSGRLDILAENPGYIQQWITDHNGNLRVAMGVKGLETYLLYRKTENDTFRTVLTFDWKDNLDPLFFTFDNENIFASSNIGRDKTAIVKLDIDNNAEEIEVLFEHPNVDVRHLNYSRKRKALTSVTYTTWKQKRQFFDEKTRKIYERLENELSDVELSISSMNKNEDKFIVRTYSDKTRGAYYLYDLKKDKLSMIHEISPWLRKEYMCDMKPVIYTARDGLTINGYLTLPKGRNNTNLPVVVNPHGGPWSRDVWGFDPEVQFLANRGYAVFQMNFRGSTGYGKEFLEASYKEWGKDMQNDITDGVRWLINEKVADPGKIAIYGGSYGGYAVLAGLAFTPDLYAAGIDYVGVSNLFTFMKSVPPYWEPLLPMFKAMVGDPEKDSTLLYEASPVFHAHKIQAPLLIAQGANDPRVNKDESDQMVEALRKRGVKVKYIVKENEGHGFRNEENKFDLYKAMEEFLDKHLKKE